MKIAIICRLSFDFSRHDTAKQYSNSNVRIEVSSATVFEDKKLHSIVPKYKTIYPARVSIIPIDISTSIIAGYCDLCDEGIINYNSDRRIDLCIYLRLESECGGVETFCCARRQHSNDENSDKLPFPSITIYIEKCLLTRANLLIMIYILFIIIIFSLFFNENLDCT